MQDLPIYEPKFMWEKDPKTGNYLKDKISLRMTMLWTPTDPRPRGGLGIVWGTSDEIQNPHIRELLRTRLPAVVELPDMWTSGSQRIEKMYPSEEHDRVWELCHANQAWSSDEEDSRAIGGYWLPANQNFLLELSKSPNWGPFTQNVHERSELLCAEHGVELPAWWSKMPCARCGGTGNIGYISTYRCPEC